MERRREVGARTAAALACLALVALPAALGPFAGPAGASQNLTGLGAGNQTVPGFEVGLGAGGPVRTEFFNLSVNLSARFGPSSVDLEGKMSAPSCSTVLGLPGVPGFGEMFGDRLVALGDVNGDGLGDLAASAPLHAAGAPYVQRVAVFYGNRDLAWPSGWNWSQQAQQGQKFGSSIAAGRYAGDSLSDLVVLGTSVDYPGNFSVFVFEGSTLGLSSSPSYEVLWQGPGDSGFGATSAGDVDLNGDGYDELLVGQPLSVNGTSLGEVVIFWGGPSGLSAANATPVGEPGAFRFAWDVSAFSDTDGDGLDEFAVGTLFNSSGAGASWTYEGVAGTRQLVRTWTYAAPDRAGFGASAAGGRDLTGDGVPDLLVGGTENGSSRGSAYVFEGTGNASYAPSPWVTLSPSGGPGEQFGGAVASVPDLNGDGVDDVLVGANGYSDADGRVYVFLMGAWRGTFALGLGAETPGDNGNLGLSVVSAGDLNGDGVSEIAAGAPLLANGTTRGGAVRVYRGQAHAFPVNATLSIGGSTAWRFAGPLVGKAQAGALGPVLQAYLDANAAAAQGGTLAIPISFSFGLGGVLNVSNVSVVYSILRPPSGLAATADPGGGAVIVSWSPQLDDATEIAIWSNKSGPFEVIARVSAASTSYRDANVSDGVRYAYFVTEEEEAIGTSSTPSITVSALAQDIVPPAVPGSLAVVANGTARTATLTWAVNGDDTVAYEVWGRVGAGGNFVLLAYLDAPASRFDHAGLLEDEDYTYIVRALDDASLASDFCAPVGVHMPNVLPPAVDFYLPTEWPDNLPVALSAVNVTDSDAKWNAGAGGTFLWTVEGAPLPSPLTRTSANVSVGPLLPGAYSVTLTATDASGLQASHTLPIRILDGTPPQLEVSVAGLFNEGDTVFFNASGSSDTNPASLLSFEWSVTVGADILEGTGPTFAVQDAPPGAITAIVKVSDSAGNNRSGLKSVHVNDLPEVRVSPLPTYTAGERFTIPVVVFDSDSQGAITYSLPVRVGTMSISSSGSIEWRPDALADYGVYRLVVRVSDGQGSVEVAFLLTITRGTSPTNHPPQFTSLPVAGVRPGETWLYTPTGSDADHDRVSFALAEGPAGMTWVAGSGLALNWTVPTDAPEGSLYRVAIRAYDGFDASTQTFDLRVRSNNAAPVVTTPLVPPSLDLTMGTVRRFPLEASRVSDPDDPLGLTFQVTCLCLGAFEAEVEVSPQGVPELVLRPLRPGNGTVMVYAVDPSGARNFSSMQVTVTAAPVEQAAGAPLGLIALGLSAAGAVAMVALSGGRRKREDEGEVAAAGAAAARGQAAVPPSRSAGPSGSPYLVESVFMLYNDGRNMFWHSTGGPQDDEDPGFLGPMFVALQDFVRDALRKDTHVSQLSYGEDAILVERGSYVVLAVTVFGDPPAALRDKMVEAVSRVEAGFAGIIEEWDGNRTRLPGLEAVLSPIWLATDRVTREEVLLITRPREVQVLSGIEFFQGFLRLKVAVVNSTLSVVTGVALDLQFDREVLALDRVEPETHAREGAKIYLGVINTGEKKTVAYYFDPLICTSSAIDGTATFRDAQGASHVAQMKRRQAEVVCPLFFTQEQANTAMLKRLVEGELPQFDVKGYTLSKEAPPERLDQLFAAMKVAVMAHDVRLVRERAPEADRARAEAWFYGETKVAGYKFVIRAVLDASEGRAEFYAASASIGAVTGMLAELNRTLMSESRRFADIDLRVHRDPKVRESYVDVASVWAMIERLGG